MKTPRFDYHAPSTVGEAVALLGEHGDESKILAGGQSLVPLLAMRLAQPAHVVDVNPIGELRRIADRGEVLAIGATVREREAERSPLVRSKVPLLAEALPLIGHVAIRNRGTVGGSIAHADASAELPAVVLTLDAELLLRSVRGDRVVPAGGFFAGHFSTVMEDDECLVEVRFPVLPAGAGFAVEEVARRHGDFAVAGAATTVTLTEAGRIGEARLSLFGVSDTPVRATEAEAALVGSTPSPEMLDEVAQVATSGLRPASDIHGSSAFRRQVARVAVRRALVAAVGRAAVPA